MSFNAVLFWVWSISKSFLSNSGATAAGGAGVSCCLLLQLGSQMLGNPSDHTDEMLFMRQSEGEMLILPCYPPDIINQSQECWSCECAIYTCTCHCGCVCISNEACVCLCCTFMWFLILAQMLRVFMKVSAQAVFKYLSCVSDAVLRKEHSVSFCLSENIKSQSALMCMWEWGVCF